MSKKPRHPGAGFVVFNKNDPSKFLALIRDDGIYDIPKGRKDGNESSLTTAKRECFEECSILIEDEEILPVGPYKSGALITYGAITDKTPSITPNVHSGILEHQGYEWVDKQTFCSNCLQYLIEPIAYYCQYSYPLI